MTSCFRLSITGAALLLVVGVASFAVAQTPVAGRQGSRMYDVKTETTVTGTVESIETIAGPAGRGPRGLGGTHLVVKAQNKSLEIHLGPRRILPRNT